MINIGDQFIHKFPSCLWENIRTLCLHEKLGLSSITAKDIAVVSHNNRQPENYHYTLKIPYAGKKLNWEIIFDPDDFDFAPTFEFNDLQFMLRFIQNLGNLETNLSELANWNIEDPHSVARILRQLLSHYRDYQLEKLRDDILQEKIYADYTVLVDKLNIPAESIEVHVDTNIVHMLIDIDIDLEGLPEYTHDDQHTVNPGQDSILLRLSYSGFGSRVTPALFTSPTVEQTLQSTLKAYQIPEWRKDVTTVDEYIKSLRSSLKQRIKARIREVEMRECFMAAIVADNQSRIVEFDDRRLLNCTFLYEIEGRKHCVEVSVDRDFPQRKPQVHLEFECEKECRMVVRNLKWEPKLMVPELLEVLYTCLKEELPKLAGLHSHIINGSS